MLHLARTALSRVVYLVASVTEFYLLLNERLAPGALCATTAMLSVPWCVRWEEYPSGSRLASARMLLTIPTLVVPLLAMLAGFSLLEA